MRHGGGTLRNRECASCVYPCSGGEVLHRRGPCSKPFCGCEGFVPKAYIFDYRPPLQEALNAQVKRRAMGARPAA